MLCSLRPLRSYRCQVTALTNTCKTFIIVCVFGKTASKTNDAVQQEGGAFAAATFGVDLRGKAILVCRHKRTRRKTRRFTLLYVATAVANRKRPQISRSLAGHIHIRRSTKATHHNKTKNHHHRKNKGNRQQDTEEREQQNQE